MIILRKIVVGIRDFLSVGWSALAVFLEIFVLPLLLGVAFAVRGKARPYPRPSTIGRQRVALRPYSTPACRTQFRFLAKALRLNGIEAKTLRKVRGVPSFRNADMTKKINFASFAEVVDWIVGLAEGDLVFARGLVDDFVRNAPLETFKGDFSVSADVAWEVARLKAWSRDVAARNSMLVIADSAYAVNRALASSFIKERKAVVVVNPDGTRDTVTESSDEVFKRYDSPKVQQLISGQALSQVSFADFVGTREGGRAISEQDSALAYSGAKEVPVELRSKKILALHVFRDANLFPLEDSEGRPPLFRTHFEWADAAFSVIRQRAEEWAIRAHPASVHLPEDRLILEHLLQKHGLSEITRVANVSTKAILEERLPIYTHCGSIALEAAVTGYRAHTASSLFPSEMANNALHQEAFKQSLTLDFDEARSGIVSARDRLVAEAMLFLRLGDRPFPFVPTPRQPSRSSRADFRKSLFIQELSLARLALQPKRVDELKRSVQEFQVLGGNSRRASA